MPNIILNIKINAGPEKVYKALTHQNHLSKWWTKDCKAVPKIGSIARFNFKSADFYNVMRIIKLRPGKLVEWKCVDAGTGTSKQWVGTKVIWKISGNNKVTNLKMYHKNWKKKTQLFRDCTSGWKYYAGKSLKKYMEKGKGMPFG